VRRTQLPHGVASFGDFFICAQSSVASEQNLLLFLLHNCAPSRARRTRSLQSPQRRLPNPQISNFSELAGK